MYALAFSAAAFKIFDKLPKNIQNKLLAEIRKLKIDPLLGVLLKGKYRYLRSLHLTIDGVDYRVLYQIQRNIKLIVIRLATTRENIYKKLDKMKIKPN